MPDTSAELIPLADVPKLPWLPKRNGKRLHKSTVFRWAQRGVGGIKLKTTRIGGARCTTEAALREFFAGLDDEDHEPLIAMRNRAHDEAVEYLRERGLA